MQRPRLKRSIRAAALKAELRSKPGDWYVVHSYAGYENKVKANLETRVQNPGCRRLHLPGGRCPPKSHWRIKIGQRKQVNRKVLPGYILCGMTGPMTQSRGA
ncbi:transcription termination/antitermination NusG family protein [Mycobacterium tuberculosis]